MIKQFLIYSVIFLALLFNVPLKANTQDLEPNTNVTIKVCHAEWSPFSFTENGRSVGLSVAIVREAIARLGFRAQFQALPWKRCIRVVQQGIFDMGLDSILDRGILYSDFNATVNNIRILANKNAKIKVFDGIKQFQGQRVGMVQASEAALNALTDFGLIVTNFHNIKSLVLSLERGRIDYFITSSPLEFLPDLDPKKYHFLEPAITHVEHQHFFKPNSEELRDRMDTVLIAMEVDGTIDRVYLNWIGISRTQIIEKSNISFYENWSSFLGDQPRLMYRTERKTKH